MALGLPLQRSPPLQRHSTRKRPGGDDSSCPPNPTAQRWFQIPESCRLCRHQGLKAPTCLRASASCSCVCDSSCRLAATETAALSSSAVALSSFSCAAALAAASAAVMPSCSVSLACKGGAAQRYIELRVQCSRRPHMLKVGASSRCDAHASTAMKALRGAKPVLSYGYRDVHHMYEHGAARVSTCTAKTSERSSVSAAACASRSASRVFSSVTRSVISASRSDSCLHNVQPSDHNLQLSDQNQIWTRGTRTVVRASKPASSLRLPRLPVLRSTDAMRQGIVLQPVTAPRRVAAGNHSRARALSACTVRRRPCRYRTDARLAAL